MSADTTEAGPELTVAEQRDFAIAALNSAQQRANTLAEKLLTLEERAATHRWMIVHSYDHGQIDVYTGTRDEMLTLYDRLTIQWTGVTLAEVYVPDANSVPGGEARRRFEALRDAVAAEPTAQAAP